MIGFFTLLIILSTFAGGFCSNINMKRIYIILFFVGLLPLAVRAQIGLEVGINMGNLALKSEGQSVGTTFKTGAAVGLAADMPFSDHVFFEPGLFLLMNGCKVKDPPTGEFDINAVNIPLYIEYKTGDRCSAKFFIGAGPYVSRNVSGSYDFNGNSGDLNIGTTGGNGSLNLKTLDLGIGMNVGYQFKNKLYFRFHYQKGLNNINLSGDDNNVIKTSSLGLTIGHIFTNCHNTKRMAGFKHSGPTHWRGLRKGHWSTRPRRSIYD